MEPPDVVFSYFLRIHSPTLLHLPRSHNRLQLPFVNGARPLACLPRMVVRS
jgi:hypothetical protein